MRIMPVTALRLLAASLCLSLSACGFQPLYAGPGQTLIDNLAVSVNGDERLSYLTETALMERIGVSEGRTRTLDVTLQTVQIPLGVSSDGQATRVALNVRANYVLEGEGGEALRRSVTERIVFETPREPYALISARANAERRAAEVVSDALVRDLLGAIRTEEAQRARPDVRPAAGSR
ncbi:MAG: LPS assembly lipoprotein LptE [Caulobacterales bacterium]|uniref:LPS assembly lipoprotein LptE n=1 Tax=Glycocaulis sp. TaxID=1969725 RepID=UPI003FA0792D